MKTTFRWAEAGVLLFCSFFLLGSQDLQPEQLQLQESASYRAEGRQFQDSGQLQKALEAYQKSVVLNPQYAEAQNDLGVILESLGDIPRAEEAYKAALRFNPNLAAAHSNLALLYERTGKTQEAAKHWAARAQMGTWEDPWTVKARSKLQEYNLPAPEPEQVVSKKRKAQAELAYRAGEKYWKEDRLDQAAAEFERALQLDPMHRGAARAIREVKLQIAGRPYGAPKSVWREPPKPQPPAAQREVAPAAGPPAVEVEIPPDAQIFSDAFARDKLRTRSGGVKELYQRGVAAMREGRYEDASEHFYQVLTLEPYNTAAKQGLERAQAALANTAKQQKPR